MKTSLASPANSFSGPRKLISNNLSYWVTYLTDNSRKDLETLRKFISLLWCDAIYISRSSSATWSFTCYEEIARNAFQDKNRQTDSSVLLTGKLIISVRYRKRVLLRPHFIRGCVLCHKNESLDWVILKKHFCKDFFLFLFRWKFPN